MEDEKQGGDGIRNWEFGKRRIKAKSRVKRWKVRKWEAERLSQGKDRNVRGEKKESDLSSKTNTFSGCGHLGKC